jgi:hypothetical protein
MGMSLVYALLSAFAFFVAMFAGFAGPGKGMGFGVFVVCVAVFYSIMFTMVTVAKLT